MKCPHCNVAIHDSGRGAQFAQDSVAKTGEQTVGNVTWTVFHQQCPECRVSILHLQVDAQGRRSKFLAYPQQTSPRPVPPEVIDPYKQDFIEACNVLPLSAKASAALSRRNLQAILRDKAATKSKDLFDQIEEVITSGKVPSHIEEGLHAVRNIGNFAAHEIKSKVTGAIVEVEAGEAEWNLDVLESLFDFYFVQPALTAKRKAELNKKLKEAGKPEIP